MKDLPKKVLLTDVGPRDGLQNAEVIVSTEDKVAMIQGLMDAGVKAIEATSFVHPKRVPPMADAEQVMAQIQRPENVSIVVLVPNMKGFERAKSFNANEINLFVAASESFNRNNVNATIEESLDQFAQIIPLAKEAGMKVRGIISTVFGCPFEGEVSLKSITNIARFFMAQGADTVSLADTNGYANPEQVKRVIDETLTHVPLSHLLMHFHDTEGMGLANVYASLQMGVYQFEASLGGLGGCPFSPGASGNIDTMDTVNMLNGLGIETGIDLKKLKATAKQLQEKYPQLKMPSHVLQVAAK